MTNSTTLHKKYVYSARVTRVIDSDTIDVTIDLGFNVLYNTRLRLAGINAPEIRTRDPEVKARGFLARNRMLAMVEGQEIIVEPTRRDKYGRYLAEIYVGNVHVSQQLITEGLAVPFMV